MTDKKKIWTKSERAKNLEMTKFAIDKFHFGNHKDKWCRKNMDPNKYPELKNLNTVVCEEVNFWLSGYKYMVKHMNQEHFHFFLYRMLNFYNETKILEN